MHESDDDDALMLRMLQIAIFICLSLGVRLISLKKNLKNYMLDVFNSFFFCFVLLNSLAMKIVKILRMLRIGDISDNR